LQKLNYRKENNLDVIIKNPEVLKIFIMCISVVFGLIFITIGMKMGWIGSVHIDKSGANIKANKKEVQRQYDAGTIKYNQDVKVREYDDELSDFAIEKSNKLRRTLAIELNNKILCMSTIRALSGGLRFPLYDASRKNNFKYKLRPENINAYIDNIMKEIIEEYKAFSIERELSYCGNNTEIKCPEMPSVDYLIDGVKRKIIDNWALPIREKNIEICNKKIELYKENISQYKLLGDEVNVKIALDRIGSNRGHIKGLERKPEPGEL